MGLFSLTPQRTFFFRSARRVDEGAGAEYQAQLRRARLIYRDFVTGKLPSDYSIPKGLKPIIARFAARDKLTHCLKNPRLNALRLEVDSQIDVDEIAIRFQNLATSDTPPRVLPKRPIVREPPSKEAQYYNTDDLTHPRPPPPPILAKGMRLTPPPVQPFFSKNRFDVLEEEEGPKELPPAPAKSALARARFIAGPEVVDKKQRRITINPMRKETTTARADELLRRRIKSRRANCYWALQKVPWFDDSFMAKYCRPAQAPKTFNHVYADFDKPYTRLPTGSLDTNFLKRELPEIEEVYTELSGSTAQIEERLDALRGDELGPPPEPPIVVEAPVGKRKKPDTWCQSSRHIENQVDGDEESPLFTARFAKFKPTGISVLGKDSIMAEEYLVSRLRVDAAFRLRTPTLLEQLKRKAVSYLDKFSQVTIPTAQRTAIILRSVAASYVPSPDEEEVRAYLSSNRVQGLVAVHNNYLTTIQSTVLGNLSARIKQLAGLPP
nr:MAG: hypothetical protein [Planococcus ficus-associated tombus-like virus 1]